MKYGIHSQNWDKLIEKIKTEIPKEYADKVIAILYEMSTNYL